MESKAIEMNTKMESKRIEVTYKKSYVSVVLKGLTWAASILAMAVLVFLVLFILVKGIGNLTADLFARCCEYVVYDRHFSGDCGASRHFCSNISCRICR